MSDSPYKEAVLEREQFGDAWPFTQPRAILRCYCGVWLTAILDGCECAINGTALSRGFPPIDPFWAGGHGIRKSMSPVFDAAMRLVNFSTHWSAMDIAMLVKNGHAPTPPSDDE